MPKIIHYFVEGKCEEKLINMLKQPKNGGYILAGKVEVLNFINEQITNLRIMNLKPGALIVLVYDTDVQNEEMLCANINKLKKHGFNKIYHIHSVQNFEDELIYSTDINKINDFISTRNVVEFKSKFISMKESALNSKLKYHDFNMDRMWSRQGIGCFGKYSTSEGIKLIKKV
ncbi:MAG: hypothetical protein MR210_02375 [Erysipelotrichaceae bacterium]|nr:hypothetical protein [Erysipelotrichaceae bacterium]MDY5251197.1 hypothetical protein [Erysipelotrichaceae bacterium]